MGAKLLSRRECALVTLGFVLACDKGNDKGSKKDEDDEDDDEDDGEKKKKSGKKKGDEETDDEASSDPLATLFTGKAEDGVVYLRMKGIKTHPVLMRFPHNWSTSRDDQTIDYVDDDISYNDKHRHAHIWMGVQGKKGSIPPNEMKLNTQRIAISKAEFEPLIDGKIGEGPYKCKIAKGTCEMFRQPAECWYAIVDFSPKQSLLVYASLKKDVYPKLEKELWSILRSLKINK